MSAVSWNQILTWALAAFFLLGAIINTFATKVVVPEFRRWGYPDRWNFITAGMELVVAILLVAPQTFRFGVALGGAIMIVAIGTVIRAREYRRALPPFIVLVLLIVAGWRMLPLH